MFAKPSISSANPSPLISGTLRNPFQFWVMAMQPGILLVSPRFTMHLGCCASTLHAQAALQPLITTVLLLSPPPARHPSGSLLDRAGCPRAVMRRLQTITNIRSWGTEGICEFSFDLYHVPFGTSTSRPFGLSPSLLLIICIREIIYVLRLSTG